MAYENLRLEMFKKDVGINDLAKVTSIRRGAVSSRFKGIGSFSVEDSIEIRKAYFPDKTLEYLFEREPGCQESRNNSSNT